MDNLKCLVAIHKLRVPITCTIEITNRCHFSCPYCYLDNKYKELPKERIIQLIEEAVSLGCVNLTLTGGDAFIHQDFDFIYMYAYKKRLKITIFTNAYSIKESTYEILRKCPPYKVECTLYGSSEEGYYKVTQCKGAYERVKDNINRLRNLGVNVYLKAFFSIINYEDRFSIAEEIRKWNSGKLQYDYNILPRRKYDWSKAKEYQLSNKDIVQLQCDISVVFEHEYEYSEGFKDYYIQSDVFPIMINASCCYSQCKFCYNGYKINNIKSKDISRLSFEIEYIMEKYKKTKFRFWDECLTPKDIIAVVKLLSDKKYKIKWYINTRFSSVLCNNNIVRDMHKTGCMGTFLGVECASDTALAKMNKNTNVELVYNVLRCLKSNGISTHISLLYGYPGITEMEYLDSKAFICENIDLIDFIDVNWLFETKYNNCQPDTAAIVWYNDMQHIVDKHNKRPYKWRYAQKWRGD